MASRCQLTGKGLQFGHKVSHSNIKTKTRFNANVQRVTFHSDVLGQKISTDVAVSTLRSVDHNGGIDQFLLNTSSRKLTDKAKKLKKKIQKVLEADKKSA